MTEHRPNYSVCCSCDAWLTSHKRVRNPEVLRMTALPSAKDLRRKALGAYHKNQSTNHNEADSREGKKLPKYYPFLVEHLYLRLVICL